MTERYRLLVMEALTLGLIILLLFNLATLATLQQNDQDTTPLLIKFDPKVDIISPTDGTEFKKSPPLIIDVKGDEIDLVWATIDSERNFILSYRNGTISYIKLNPLLAEDFTGTQSDIGTRTRIIPIGGELTYVNGVLLIEMGGFKFAKIPLSNFTVEFKTSFVNNAGVSNPYVALDFLNNDSNYVKIHIYPNDSDYLPSGGFIGQKNNDNWNFSESFSPIEIGYNKWYNFTIKFENSQTRVYINDIPWLNHTLQDFDRKFNEFRLTVNGIAFFDNFIIYEEFGRGPHTITVYAKNKLWKIAFDRVNIEIIHTTKS